MEGRPARALCMDSAHRRRSRAQFRLTCLAAGRFCLHRYKVVKSRSPHRATNFIRNACLALPECMLATARRSLSVDGHRCTCLLAPRSRRRLLGTRERPSLCAILSHNGPAHAATWRRHHLRSSRPAPSWVKMHPLLCPLITRWSTALPSSIGPQPRREPVVGREPSSPLGRPSRPVARTALPRDRLQVLLHPKGCTR